MTALVKGKLYRFIGSTSYPEHIWEEGGESFVPKYKNILPVFSTVLYLETTERLYPWHKIIFRDMIGWVIGDLDQLLEAE